ncbi:MAG: S8 family serine peptidase [Pyrinomonadaceae bacterium]
MQGSFLSMKSRSTRFGLLFLLLFTLTIFLAAALPPTSSATQEQARSNNSQKRRPKFVPGQALVRYRSERLAKQKTLEKLVSSDGRQLSIQIERFEGADIVPGLRLAHVAPEDTMAAIAALKAQPDVLYAEPNYLLHLDANPNDPRFLSNELYGLLKIGAPTAWDTIKGSSDTVQAGFGSPRIVVGVIDEGIDLVHEDLAANIWTNPGEGATPDGLDNDSNGFVDDIHGYDFALNSGTITPQTHGTHVAGTIGAVGNNAIGVVGVNWGVGLMSLKFIDGFQADTADSIRACNYAKMMRDLWVSSGGTQGANLRILNNSYGDDQFTQSFLDSINALNQSGILFVASAGNVDGFSTQPDNDIVPHYPSGYAAPNVIGVASTGQTDNLAGDSHFGAATVQMGAPGIGILSTTPGNTYSFLSGTSMATPHVAGAAALLLAQNPNLTIQQLKGLLIYNGDPVASLAGKTVTGKRLNVANSMAAVAENDVTAPGTVGNFHVNTQTGRSFNIGWTASGDDGASGQASLYAVSFTDASSGAVIFLKNVIPAASGVVQAVDVKIPYRHLIGTISLREFDNAGNEGVPATLAVSVSPNEGDPYLTPLSAPVALSTGGVGLSTNCDDCFKTQALPFSFPFFGENFISVKVTSNGAMYFTTPPANDAVSSAVGLAQFKMIAGLWDDLRTDRRVGDDIYVVTPDANTIIFRWQTVTFGNGTLATELPVSFEIELRSNGTILTRYGSAAQSPDADTISRVVGISAGELDTYVIPSHTAEGTIIDLTNAQTVTFLPRSLTHALTVASINPSSSVSITVSPADGGGQGNGTTPFVRGYLPSTTVNLTAPATTGSNRFQKWQRDGVDWSTNPATSLSMDAPHTMTAVYIIGRTLTVASANPNTGVNITVSPNDNNSLGNGTTQFTRLYDISSVVNLTAPATAAGSDFVKWQRDGVDFSTNQATSVTMDINHTMTAVYVNGVQFSLPQFDVTESGLSATIMVTRSGDTSMPASVNYATSDGTATQKGDYTQVAGKLTFAAGETSKSFPVLIVDDVFQESTETFNVTLTNPIGTILGATSVAAVAISDNDSPGTPNPLDNANALFFVRQHYLDFLNREPDAGGLAFWADQITSCGSDQSCIEIRRINVSAAFFLSIEFQETGYLVERMYKVAYGDATGTSTFPGPGSHQLSVPIIRRSEFVPDSFQISNGVVIGQPGALQLLEANKVVFANDFVTRTRFTTAYATSLTPAQFVDALIAKAGFTPTPAERQTFIDQFAGAPNTTDTEARARTVRAIAENGTFSQLEKNRAFVLMQYFGYLRRDPNVGTGPNPDTDYTGYDFWLTKLLQFNGNFVNAEMVKAFIVSGEYRHRFGP